MTDLAEYEDTVAALRAAFGDVHYRRPVPLRSRTRLPMWVAAASLVIVAAVMWIGSGVDDVAWAAIGRVPTDDEARWISRSCAAEWISTAEIHGERPIPLPPLMASEVRGQTAVLTFADDSGYTTCIVQDLDAEAPFVSAISTSTPDEFTRGDSRLRFDFLGLGWSPDGAVGPNMFITGTIGETVDRVVITTSRLGEIEATVENGWFTAWWPTTDSFTVTALDLEGKPVSQVTVD